MAITVTGALEKPKGRAEWPVFLVGCHRSGTTLARYFLDAHPRLACPPETKFIGGLDAFLRYPQLVRALNTLGIGADEIFAALRTLTCGFLDGYAARHGKARWVDKTPNYYRHLPLIDAMFCGRVSYLFITRHPLDSIVSLEESMCFTAPSESQDDPEIAAAVRRYGSSHQGWAHYWCEVNTAITVFAESAPSRCLLFRYEDLVASPTEVLRQVFDHLGEDQPDNLIATAFDQPHTPGFQDWKIARTTGLHAESVGRWAAWPVEQIGHIWEIVRPVAESLGYSHSSTVLRRP